MTVTLGNDPPSNLSLENRLYCLHPKDVCSLSSTKFKFCGCSRSVVVTRYNDSSTANCNMPQRSSSLNWLLATCRRTNPRLLTSPNVSPTNSFNAQSKASSFATISRLLIFAAGAVSGSFFTVVAMFPRNDSFCNNTNPSIQKSSVYTRLTLRPYEAVLAATTAPPMAQDGWKAIHVFFGNATHIADASEIPAEYYYRNHEYHPRSNNQTGNDTHFSEPTVVQGKKQQRKWFAQLKQDLIVATLYQHKRNGYFVDLAANDAVRISNTQVYYNG
jgi:hypothetical protein